MQINIAYSLRFDKTIIYNICFCEPFDEFN